MITGDKKTDKKSNKNYKKSKISDTIWLVYEKRGIA